MDIISEYRARIQQATTPEQKKAIAAELHRLADSFDEVQKADYEQSMYALHQDVAHQLEAIEPAIQRANAILKRYEPVVKQ